MRWHLARSQRRHRSRGTGMASKETDQFTTRPKTFIEEAGTSLKAFYVAAATRRLASYFNLGKNLSS
jgi:hypothetical protein